MRIALAQLDTTVGAFEENLAKVREAAHAAAKAGARIVVAPELTVMGYPPRDFLEHVAFVEQSVAALDRFARSELPKDLAVVIGAAEPHGSEGARLYNGAVVIENGGIIARARKSLLPTYDVFDEARYFDPSHECTVVAIDGVAIGITICEDLWNDRTFWVRRRYVRDPAAELAKQGARIIVNLSASPYALGKPELREKMLAATAKRHGLPIAQCNLVGGNDALVFDGHSIAFDGEGRTIARAKGFEEQLLVVELEPGTPRNVDLASATGVTHRAPGEAAMLMTPLPGESTPEQLDEVLAALVRGTRDYARKTGFKKAVLGLSGGIDSALVAVIAARAFGPENVTTVSMPSRYTMAMSNDDARVLAENLGVPYELLSIEGPFQQYLELLAPVFADRPVDVTEENLQARVRGALLMALSNKFGSLLLTTGNKSELATGYCTLYGDMCGGLAVIGDVPKTLVFALCERINAVHGGPLIPTRIITRPPSAELREDQKDEDSLPPYPVLDRILRRHVEAREEAQEIAEHEPDITRETIDRVVRLVRRNEYKRRQAAPVLRVTPRAFGEGWRFPIAHGVK